MPVRNRKYEHLLQALMGALIAIAVLYAILQQLVLRCALIFEHFKAIRK